MAQQEVLSAQSNSSETRRELVLEAGLRGMLTNYCKNNLNRSMIMWNTLKRSKLFMQTSTM